MNYMTYLLHPLQSHNFAFIWKSCYYYYNIAFIAFVSMDLNGSKVKDCKIFLPDSLFTEQRKSEKPIKLI